MFNHYTVSLGVNRKSIAVYLTRGLNGLSVTSVNGPQHSKASPILAEVVRIPCCTLKFLKNLRK